MTITTREAATEVAEFTAKAVVAGIVLGLVSERPTRISDCASV